MTRQALMLMALATGIFVIAGFILNNRLRNDTLLALRVRDVQRTVGIDAVIAPVDGSRSKLLRLIAGVGDVITGTGLLSVSALQDLEKRLLAAGFRGRNVLALFVGGKLLLLAGCPLLAWVAVSRSELLPSLRLALIATAGVVGLLAPDYLVRQLHKRHLQAVERGLPDALDMLVICSEAGLGLEPAIERVGREIMGVNPAVADELLNTAREMRVNADRRAALTNMGERTRLLSLRRLGVTLVQTLQYGTPLSQALRTLSAEMRQEALTRFEARAGRLPTLLTVPMIVFILPCVFLIVGGPAVVHIQQLLFH
jgi:tight adherence protein C